MAQCERYFWGLVSGESRDCFSVDRTAFAGKDDQPERASASEAIDRAEAIYAESIASIRVGLGAYARVWIAQELSALRQASTATDAKAQISRRLDAPLAAPATLQGLARALFDPPRTDVAPIIARFGFDIDLGGTPPPSPLALAPTEIGALRAATYPFLALKPRFMDGADLLDPSLDIRLSSYFGLDVTRPTLFRQRLIDGLVKLLRPAAAGDPTRAHFEPPRVFVGRSLTHIPLAYALSDQEISHILAAAFDASDLPQEAARHAQTALGTAGASWMTEYRERLLRQCRADLKYVFPFPDLMDIDDRYVDGSFRTRKVDGDVFRFLPTAVQAEIAQVKERFEVHGKKVSKDDRRRGERSEPQPIEEPATREISRPLLPFDAKRVDYSLSRLEHYTGTAVEDFQPYIFFTNYGFYVETFIGELYENRVCKGEGRLIAPLDLGKLGLSQSESPRLGFAITQDLPHKLQKAGQPSALDLAQATIFAPKQMPTVHFVPNRGDEAGVTIINIGVGPSNAKTITDMLAVLAPHAWLMLGHCGGLRRTQQLGQFVLAQAYVRDDHVLDKMLPPELPAPAVLEVQECLMHGIEDALLDEDADETWGAKRFAAYRDYKRDVLSLLRQLGVEMPDPTRLTFEPPKDDNQALAEHPLMRGAGLGAPGAGPILPAERTVAVRAAYKAWRKEIRARVRTGTVLTTDDRNWELRPLDEIIDRFERSKAIAVDMESATIAGTGLRYRVPYGALLCVSDKPLMGEPKMRAQADAFYQTATRNHVRIGLRTVAHLFARRDEIARSRKLNGLDDPPIM